MSKKSGERRRLPVLEHVTPPRVARWIEPHMVGDEVEDQAHPALAEFRRQRIEVLVRPEFLVERVVVADVVTVRAASCRFQERRAVAVADPQLLEVGDQTSSVCEAEV